MTNACYEREVCRNHLSDDTDKSGLISIITVVFNDVLHIESTIKSVLAQTYENVEYIIIDGGSTDGTLDIIKKYNKNIDSWISEDDKGIYDAMNKGIDLVSGDWINFMNSGDAFYNTSVIKEIFNQKEHHDTDVVFGHHNVIYPNKERVVNAGSAESLWKGSQFCHQSCFIKSSLHKNNKFNISNRIGADFEFFYNAYKKHKNFQPVDMIISSVSSGGLSDLKRVDSIVGWWSVVEKTSKVNFYYIFRVLTEMIKIHIKKII